MKIESIDDEGRGRAHVEGWDYAVRGAFPGDEVEVKVERVFKAHRLYVCRVKRFSKKGPAHVPRTCHHREPCPACPLHGVKSSVAEEVKCKRIKDALERDGIEAPIRPMVPHPDLMGYRQRVKLMAFGEPGDIQLGVYIPYSHVFSKASACPHVHPAINQAIEDLIPVLNQARVEGLIAVILRAGQDGVAGVLVTSKPLPQEVFDLSPLLSLSERIQKNPSNNILAGILGRQVGQTEIRSLEDGQWVDPDAFCQTDPKQAVWMYDKVADFLWDGPGKYIDAYAGVGGFSKALIKKGDCEIIAIESHPASAKALSNLKIGFYAKPVAECTQELQALENIQGLVADPPKKGLMTDAEFLAKLGAKRVVLVSCDPNAMARDLKVFLENGYQVHEIIPVDFFGATPAIETLVLMYKPEHCGSSS